MKKETEKSLAEQRIIDQADSWARSLWDRSLKRWADRTGQDRTYRQLVIHPFLFDYLESNLPRIPRHLLDLGCGDGILMNDPRFQSSVGDGGSYLGVDLSGTLMGLANSEASRANTSFLAMNVTSPGLVSAVLAARPSWDAVLSVFMVQEIADIHAFFRNLEPLLAPDTRALVITVHPDFAEWLRERGRLAVNPDLSGGSVSAPETWRWAGAYPIVDEPREPFYLPHFQRSFEDYRAIIEQSGLVLDRVIELPPSGTLPGLVRGGISPFRPFEGNVYWPRISETPSSAALVIRKGMR